MTAFLSGCGTRPETEIVKEVAKQEAARVVTKVVRVVEKTPPPPLPALPQDCRTTEDYKARVNESLESVLIAADAAVSRGNARIQRCAAHYDELRKVGLK